MDLYDVCIIGAGAAGMTAGIAASGHGSNVIIIDKNKKAGMKLYATGNGRCNLANSHMASCCYYDNQFALKILGEKPHLEVLNLMSKFGIKCIEKNGYYYPRSNQASSVVWALLDKLKENNCEIKLNTLVTDIKLEEDIYSISFEKGGCIKSKKVIYTGGGLSMPSLGAVDKKIADKILKSQNINIKSYRPILCPIITNVDELHKELLNGVRVSAEVKIKDKNTGENVSEIGEVQFTDYGLSGIVIFNMSYYEFDKIKVDVLYDISRDDFLEQYRENSESLRSIYGFLNGFLNDKLALYILERYGKYSKKILLKDLNENDINDLYDFIKELSFTYKDNYGFDHSQATSGGIDVSELNENMEITRFKNMYAAGEAVDVVGKCGGYNLMWAFISGYKAGGAAIC